MKVEKRVLTAESVTEGHPDKVCDQVADAILDETLAQDPNARCACEVLATNGIIFITGEITTTGYVDFDAVTRKTLNRIGYVDTRSGFDGNHCAVLSSIQEQSSDIAQGVNQSEESREGEGDDKLQEGAGDQGIMFGYACKETENYMPLTTELAHKLSYRLAQVRKEGIVDHLRPDGKTQVSVEYMNGKPNRVRSILISAQHDPEITMKELKEELWTKVVVPTIDPSLLDSETRFFVNPTGRFEKGGPAADSGLTGRKIIIDTYGDRAHHGGGAFSGKDPSKVDRSATYFARYVAKNMVAAGLADEVEIELAYAIGRATPFSMDVNSFSSGKYSDQDLTAMIQEVFDFRPAAIIQTLDLRRPIYGKTAAYGHFGRQDEDFPWERLDRVQDLQEVAKKYQELA